MTKYKVQDVFPGDEGPTALVIKTGDGNLPTVGATLRCGGYRFEVYAVHGASNPGQFGLGLLGWAPVRVGMILRSAEAPLSDEEFAAAAQRLMFIVQCALEVDADGLSDRIGALALSSEDPIATHYDRAEAWPSMFDLVRALNAFRSGLPGIEQLQRVYSATGELNKLQSVLHAQGGGSSVVRAGS